MLQRFFVVAVAFVASLDLLDLKWCHPIDTGHTPEAFFVHTDEAEALQGHLGWIIGLAGVNELIGRDPLGERAHILPEELVVLGHSLRGRHIINLITSLGRRLVDYTRLGPRECA